MNTKSFLTEVARTNHLEAELLQLPDCDLDTERIKVVMVSEGPPPDPEDGFYSQAARPADLGSALGLFAEARVEAKSMQDILDLGLYLTTAVKTPKTNYAVAPETIKAHRPVLEAELGLFPNLKVIMLMGDVAKKAVNLIAKTRTKKNIIPSESTYKIRGREFWWGPIRVFPSYILTGGNILIEKSKREMIADDIRRMMAFING